jgi:hypothetical protein
MALRALSLAIVLLVVAYWGLRVAATACTGTGCDVYIPFSLMLPVAAIFLAGFTGAYAGREARNDRTWAVVLNACAGLAFFGPILAATLIRGENDLLVALATVLVLTVPASVGLYSATTRTTIT